MPRDGQTGHPDARETSRSRHWTQDRLHADVQRAVGGVLNLVREAARISERLDPSVSANWALRRLLFHSFELRTYLPPDASDHEKIRALNQFLFVTQGFKTLSDAAVAVEKSSAYRLGAVLTTRAGAPIVIELIYAYLAETIGISVDFVDLKPTCFLRWRADGLSRYIDMSRKGRILSSEELIETLHQRFRLTCFSNSNLLEAVNFDGFVANYVQAFKSNADLCAEPELLLFLQDTLIAYRPSDLHLIGERALLHRRLGNFKPALADLKRYFAFNDRSRAPLEFLQLFEELTDMIEKKGTSIEVLD